MTHYDRKVDDEVEYILYSNENLDLDHLMLKLSWIDFSENDLSITNFARLFDRPNQDTLPALQDVNNQLKVFDSIVSSGLKLDSKQKGGSFTYGHQVMRSGASKLVEYALSHKFTFNQYTDNPCWHSLELLQMNYLSVNSEKPELLDIISKQLKKGVNLDKTAPEDFFLKLNSRSKSEGWGDLIELYRNDDFMKKYFNEHTNLIIKKEFFNLIPKDALDIFVF